MCLVSRGDRAQEQPGCNGAWGCCDLVSETHRAKVMWARRPTTQPLKVVVSWLTEARLSFSVCIVYARGLLAVCANAPSDLQAASEPLPSCQLDVLPIRGIHQQF